MINNDICDEYILINRIINAMLSMRYNDRDFRVVIKLILFKLLFCKWTLSNVYRNTQIHLVGDILKNIEWLGELTNSLKQFINCLRVLKCLIFFL